MLDGTNTAELQDFESDKGLLEEKQLTSGEWLRMLEIEPEEVEGEPENNLFLMLHANGDPAGDKFAPRVSHLLPGDRVRELYTQITSKEEWVKAEREEIARVLAEGEVAD